MGMYSYTQPEMKSNLSISVSPRFMQYLNDHASPHVPPACIVKPYSHCKTEPKVLRRDNPVPSIWLIRRKLSGYTAAVTGLGLQRILSLKGRYWQEVIENTMKHQEEDKSYNYRLFGRVITVVRKRDVKAVEQAKLQREHEMQARDIHSKEREQNISKREGRLRHQESNIAAWQTSLSQREMTVRYREQEVGHEEQRLQRREWDVASKESNL